jgi:hypothetical protein
MLRPDRPESQPRPAAPVASLPAPTKAERLRLVRQFVARVGGVQNARQALAMLTLIGRAS